MVFLRIAALYLVLLTVGALHLMFLGVSCDLVLL